MSAPSRPAQVPSHAAWDEAEHRWRALDGTTLRTYREDGTLELEGQARDGVLHGPFRLYNPGGSLAREGRYADGALDGVVRCHAPRGPGDAPLRGCCVPPGAAHMEASYRAGQLRRERFFDAEGRLLLSDGRPCPERPPGVPAHAEFEESSGRWRAGPEDEASDGEWTWYRADATCDERVRTRSGKVLARTRFDGAGRAREGCEYLEHDGFEEIPHGEFWRRYGDEEPSPYLLPGERVGVHVVRGRYDHGRMVGRWLLEDDAGAELARAERGTSPDPEALAQVLAPADARDAAAWQARAEALLASGQVGAALLACARGCAARGDPAPLRDLLARVALPLQPATRLAEAERATERDTPWAGPDAQGAGDRLTRLCDALVAGADAPAILCALSVQLAGAPELGLALCELALLLEPGRPTSLLARAFILIELGRFERAAADARALAASDAETARFLDDYLRALQPTWAFAPALAGELPELPGDAEARERAQQVQVAQPAGRVRWAARLYATRLARVRARLTELCGEPPPWAPPVPAWLEEPVPLRREEADIEDEDEDGNLELTRVRLDEAEGLDVRGAPALVRAARASWAALCWLCWAAGQNGAQPPADDARDEDLAGARPEYARALNLALVRAFRAHDGLVTGGLRSLSQGVPGFDWEGQPVESLSRTLLELAAAEWLEVRAVLLWLTSPGNLSPFQDDLRRV